MYNNITAQEGPTLGVTWSWQVAAIISVVKRILPGFKQDKWCQAMEWNPKLRTKIANTIFKKVQLWSKNIKKIKLNNAKH
jgi:hypothetical protein